MKNSNQNVNTCFTSENDEVKIEMTTGRYSENGQDILESKDTFGLASEKEDLMNHIHKRQS